MLDEEDWVLFATWVWLEMLTAQVEDAVLGLMEVTCSRSRSMETVVAICDWARESIKRDMVCGVLERKSAEQ